MAVVRPTPNPSGSREGLVSELAALYLDHVKESKVHESHFTVVAKRAKICGIDDSKELVKILRQEQDIKEVKSNPIGFST